MKVTDKNDDKWNRRNRNPFLDIFSEFDRIEEMMNQFFEEDPFEKMRKGEPMAYGFSISTNDSGKPKVEEFGNLHTKQKETKASEEKELLVEVMEKDNSIDILAEVPGVNENELEVSSTSKKLIIDASGRFRKEIALPVEVNPESVNKTLKNGVLTIQLEKK